MKKYLIIDPTASMPSLYFVLSSSPDENVVEYFSDKENRKLPWSSYRNNELEDMYGYKINCLSKPEDKKKYNSYIWDCIFVIFPFKPSLGINHQNSKQVLLDIISELKHSATYKKLALIDNSDECGSYHKELIESGILPDVVFKKEFNRNLEIYDDVYAPFPYIVLGFKDILWILNEKKYLSNTHKIDRVYWGGNITHENN